MPSPGIPRVLMWGNSGKTRKIARTYLARKAVPSDEIGRTAGKIFPNSRRRPYLARKEREREREREEEKGRRERGERKHA